MYKKLSSITTAASAETISIVSLKLSTVSLINSTLGTDLGNTWEQILYPE